jgi:dihydroorotate dehydrogenase electron transfer subunit
MFAHETKIISNIRITSDTSLIALRSPEIVSQAWPGQFVMLRVGAGIDPLLRRPFSICGVKDDLKKTADMFLWQAA